MNELEELSRVELIAAIQRINKKYKDFEVDDSFIEIFLKMIAKKKEGEPVAAESVNSLLDSIKYTEGE
jgi:hypothetical protein